MKLWKIWQAENSNYDTYDSAVVAAPDEEVARDINPGYHGESWQSPTIKWPVTDRYTDWARNREAVYVEYIGEAKEGTTTGVIIASFNAG